MFQRSSSNVEGRNGYLSLRNHQLRGLDLPRKRECFTAIHNFFLTRPDGTTAAERFFGQKPRSMFAAILGSVELPPAPLSPPRSIKWPIPDRGLIADRKFSSITSTKRSKAAWSGRKSPRDQSRLSNALGVRSISWSDGTTGIKLSPLKLLEKLLALVRLPRVHLVRYTGCLAPHSARREAIIPTPSQQGVEEQKASTASPHWSWARLLKGGRGRLRLQ